MDSWPHALMPCHVSEVPFQQASVYNEKISNECIYIADKKDFNPSKRIFRLRFNFNNKLYDKSKRYYLVAYDEKNGIEVLRHCVVMDIAFADDFGSVCKTGLKIFLKVEETWELIIPTKN